MRSGQPHRHGLRRLLVWTDVRPQRNRLVDGIRSGRISGAAGGSNRRVQSSRLRPAPQKPENHVARHAARNGRGGHGVPWCGDLGRYRRSRSLWRGLRGRQDAQRHAGGRGRLPGQLCGRPIQLAALEQGARSEQSLGHAQDAAEHAGRPYLDRRRCPWAEQHHAPRRCGEPSARRPR
jgi:hypothetical protein